MKAISDRHYEMMHPTRPSHRQDMGIPDVSAGGTHSMLPAVNNVVHAFISVASADSAWSLSSDPYGQNARQTQVVLSNSAYQWVEPRSLRLIDPTVTFRSISPLPLYSTCSVYCGSTVVHTEQPLAMAVQDGKDPLGTGASYLHYTRLTPGYWDTLCSCTGTSSLFHACSGASLTYR